MTKCALPVPRAESGLRANRGSRHPLARSRERPTTRKIMGANVVSAKCVIGCWAQGAWRAPAGCGVVSRGPAEGFCAVAGPIRGEILPNPDPALHPQGRVCPPTPQRLRAENRRAHEIRPQKHFFPAYLTTNHRSFGGQRSASTTISGLPRLPFPVFQSTLTRRFPGPPSAPPHIAGAGTRALEILWHSQVNAPSAR